MPRKKRDDLGRLVWVGEHIAYLVINDAETESGGKVLVQWQDSNHRECVDESAILGDVIAEEEEDTVSTCSNKPQRRPRRHRSRSKSTHGGGGDDDDDDVKENSEHEKENSEDEEEAPPEAKPRSKPRLNFPLRPSKPTSPSSSKQPTIPDEIGIRESVGYNANVSDIEFEGSKEEEEESYSRPLNKCWKKNPAPKQRRASVANNKRKPGDDPGSRRPLKKTSADKERTGVSLGWKKAGMTYSSRDKRRRVSVEGDAAADDDDSDCLSFRTRMAQTMTVTATKHINSDSSQEEAESAATPRHVSRKELPATVTTAKAVPRRRKMAPPKRTTRPNNPSKLLLTRSVTQSIKEQRTDASTTTTQTTTQKVHDASSISEQEARVTTAARPSPERHSIHKESMSWTEPNSLEIQPKATSTDATQPDVSLLKATDDAGSIMTREEMDQAQEAPTFLLSPGSPNLDAMSFDINSVSSFLLDDKKATTISFTPNKGASTEDESEEVAHTMVPATDSSATASEKQRECSPPAHEKESVAHEVSQAAATTIAARNQPSTTSPPASPNAAPTTENSGDPTTFELPATQPPPPKAVSPKPSRSVPTNPQLSASSSMKSPDDSHLGDLSLSKASRESPAAGATLLQEVPTTSPTASQAQPAHRRSIASPINTTGRAKETPAAPATAALPWTPSSSPNLNKNLVKTNIAENEKHATTNQVLPDTPNRKELEAEANTQGHQSGSVAWDADSISEMSCQTNSSIRREHFVSENKSIYEIASLVMTEGSTSANEIIESVEDRLNLYLTSSARAKLKDYIDCLLANSVQQTVTTLDLGSDTILLASDQCLDIFLEDGIDHALDTLLKNFHNRSIIKVSVFADASSVASFAQSSTLFSSIAKIQNVQEVTISYCRKSLNVGHLMKIFTMNSSIRKLKLINVELSGRDEDFHALSQSERNFRALQEIHLVGCIPSENLNPISFQAWLSELSRYAPLTKVWLDQVQGLPAEFVGKLCRTFQRFELGLRCMPVPHNIFSFGNLTKLHLIDCIATRIEDAAPVISQTPTMKDLFLWGTMNQETAVHFLCNLQSNTGLERLTMTVTGGVDVSALFLDRLLEKNKVLRSFDLVILGGVQNAAKASARILKALETNNKIVSLRIFAGKRDETGRQSMQAQFANTFRKNRNLQTLHLFGQ